MADHADFYPLIAPETIGCPSPTIDNAINRAAREFCKGSLVWQEVLAALQFPAGTHRATLPLSDGAALVAVQSVRADGRALIAMSDPRGAIEWGAVSGMPARFALLPGWREIAIDPAPIESATLVLNVTLTPTLAATSLPDVLAEQHAEAIADGAKAILKRMPGQPWTDFAASQFYEAEFRHRTAKARIEREYGAAPSLVVTPRAFG